MLFSEAELAVIADIARQRRLEAPDNLGAAIILLARMGGYLQRRHRPEPTWSGKDTATSRSAPTSSSGPGRSATRAT